MGSIWLTKYRHYMQCLAFISSIYMVLIEEKQEHALWGKPLSIVSVKVNVKRLMLLLR